MSVVVEPVSLKKTQEELGKYIKKPPLTEKLLNKPPFRFLHDVINAIITETGFLAGLFTDDELSSGNIKDKEAKVVFLQKCIDATVLATGEDITVRPSKIVAGHEADKTNEWLQALGRAIATNVDSTEAVQQVLSGAKPEKSKKPEKAEKTEKTEKKSEKSREKTDKKPDRSKKEASGTNSKITKDAKTTRARKPPAAQDQTKPSQGSRTKPASEPNKTTTKQANNASGTNKTTRARKPPSTDAKPKATQGSRTKPSSEPNKTTTRQANNALGTTNNITKDTTSTRACKPLAPETEPNLSKPTQGSRLKPSSEPNITRHSVEDGSRGSRDSKDKTSRKTKDDKTKTSRGKSSREKSKEADKGGSPDKAKSSKSRPASRVGDVTEESGKENSPPPETIEEAPVIPNGHATDDEMASAPTLGSARPTSTRLGIHSAAAEEEITNGPTSLMQLDGDEGGEGEREGDELISNNNNNIDPAILKAVAPNSDLVQEGAPSPPPHPPDPPDSGVGSLESPKQRPSSHTPPQRTPPTPTPPQRTPPTPAPGQRGAVTPGPQPMRAPRGQFGDAGGEGGDGEAASKIPTAPPPPPQGGQGGNRPRTGRRSARPPSARPAPPRVRERREVDRDEQEKRPGTAKPVANVILTGGGGGGGAGGAEDDGDDFMVAESKPALALDDTTVTVDAAEGGGMVNSAGGSGGDGAGLLVAQILETKKEMEDGRRNAFSPETPGHRRVPIEQALLSDANRRKEREVIQKDVQKLSGSIQSITRSVNPLAKMLDYLQEDLDSMHKELETWQTENKQLAHTLRREQGATDQSLEPLKTQLVDLETAVQEQRDKLSAVKSNILRNNDKIGRLMAGINLNI